MECTVRRRLLLLPWLAGTGAGEGAVREPGSLRPAAEMGTAVQEHPRRVVQSGPPAKGGGGVALAHLGVPRALHGARVQGAIPWTLDSRRRGSELEVELWLGGGVLPVSSGVPAADPKSPGSLLYQERRAGV